jgi:hypothetical protein
MLGSDCDLRNDVMAERRDRALLPENQDGSAHLLSSELPTDGSCDISENPHGARSALPRYFFEIPRSAPLHC